VCVCMCVYVCVYVCGWVCVCYLRFKVGKNLQEVGVGFGYGLVGEYGKISLVQRISHPIQVRSFFFGKSLK